MKTFSFSAIILALIGVYVSCQEENLMNKPGLSIEETFDLYVKCIDNLDLDGLMSTVTTGDDFVFLTSGGSVIDSVEGYRNFHADWFADTDWTCTFEKKKIKQWENHGYVLATYTYEGNDPEGNRHKSTNYFTLQFRKEDGMWKVYYDQITVIRTPPPQE